MGRTLEILTIADIVEINRRMIAEFGGTFLEGNRNLAHPGSLEHILEEIQSSLFGRELYPTLVEKAAVTAWRIITNHIFYDGNKRTGMETCRLFLELNGYKMRIDKEVVKAALDVATNKIQFPEFVQWVEQRTSKIE